MVYSADWYKLLIKTLSSALHWKPTLFTQRSRDAITLMWKMRHFPSEQKKVSKSDIVEKVIPAASFW